MLAVYGSLYLGFALVLAVLVVFGLGIAMHVENRWRRWIMPSVFPLIAFGIAAGSLLSNRNLAFAGLDLNMVSDGVSAGAGWILRLISALVMGFCLARILGEVARHGRAEPIGGSGLMLSYAMFFAANSVLNSAFGSEPAFSHNLVYPAIIMYAAFAARREGIEAVVSSAKASLLALMIASLAAAIVVPSIAVQPDYKGWIAGLGFRLWGVGSNANSIAPLALVYLLLEYLQPYRMRLFRVAAIAAAVAVFALAQSKTTWGAALFVTGILAWYRREGVRERAIGLPFGFAIAMTLSAILLILLVLDVGYLWDRLMASRVGTDVLSLSGRSELWQVAIGEWTRNPLFGYGSTMWDAEYRQRIGLSFAFSAHNQFLQSLGGAGLFGLLGVFAYLWVLGNYALRAADATKGATAAILALILLRCITEAPVTTNTVLNGDFLVHLLLFQLVLALGSRRYQPKQSASTAPQSLLRFGEN